MNSDCPDHQSLQLLLLGKLSGRELEAIGEHLSQCEHCTKAAETVTADDDLTAAIRSAPEFSTADTDLAKAIAASKLLVSGAGAGSVGDTKSIAFDDSRSHGGLSWNESGKWPDLDLSFLEPASSNEEIGRLGGYRILNVLGVGGMGIVFHAEDMQLQREVALKVMKPSMAANATAKDRFMHEARSAAAIDHDHIVHIYQVGEDRGVPFIAMQYLRGETLRSRLDREGSLDQGTVIRIGHEVAVGLNAAHECGMIHRDIKPDNIWLQTLSDDDPSNFRVKILDFGLVRSLDDDPGLTTSGMVLGTPRYMSPEQAQGEEVDARCDLFSLGSVLYHAITGTTPFAGKNIASTLVSVVNHHPTPVAKVLPGTERQLAGIVDGLLAKEPAKRPNSAAVVAGELRAIAERRSLQESQLTTEISTLSRSRRRLSPWLIGAASVALLLFVYGVVVMVETPQGTLRIEVDDPNLTVLVDGNEIELSDKTWKGEKKAKKYQLALKLGDQQIPISTSGVFTVAEGGIEYLLSVNRNGVKLSSDEFEVTRRGDTVLSISLVRRIREKTVVSPPIVGRVANLGNDVAAEIMTLSGHSRTARFVQFSPDGKTLASASYDGTVRLWDVPSRTHIRTLAGHSDIVYALAFSPDGNLLATGSRDRRAAVWNVATGEIVRKFPEQKRWIYGVGFSPNGKRLATAGTDGTIRIYNVDSGEQLQLLLAHTDSVRSVAFDSTGKRLVSGGTDGNVFLWELETEKPIAEFSKPFEIHQVSFVTDDKVLIATGYTGELCTWNPKQPSPQTIVDDGFLGYYALDPNRRWVATTNRQFVRIWDFATGRFLATLSGHTADIIHIAVSPDGNTLATASSDKTVKLWDTTKLTGDLDAIIAAKGDPSQIVAGLEPTYLNDFDKPNISLSDNGLGIWREIRDSSHRMTSPEDNNILGDFGWPVATCGEALIDVTARVVEGHSVNLLHTGWLVILHKRGSKSPGVTIKVDETGIKVFKSIFDKTSQATPRMHRLAFPTPIEVGKAHRLQVLADDTNQQITLFLDGLQVCPPIKLPASMLPIDCCLGISHHAPGKKGVVEFERLAIYPFPAPLSPTEENPLTAADRLVAGLTPTFVQEFDTPKLFDNKESDVQRDIRGGRHVMKWPASNAKRGLWTWSFETCDDGIIDVTGRIVEGRRDKGNLTRWMVMLHKANSPGPGILFRVADDRVSTEKSIYDKRDKSDPLRKQYLITRDENREAFHRLQLLVEGSKRRITPFFDGEQLGPPIELDDDFTPARFFLGMEHQDRDQTGVLEIERYAFYPLPSPKTASPLNRIEGPALGPDDGWIDLLTDIDLTRDTDQPHWKLTSGLLQHIGEGSDFLHLPVKVDGDYEIAVRFSREDDEPSGYGLMIPLGNDHAGAQHFGFGRYHGISSVKGIRFYKSGNPTSKIKSITGNKEYESLLRVTSTGEGRYRIECEFEGQELYNYEGPVTDVANSAYVLPIRQPVIMSGSRPIQSWHEIKLRMLNGEARVINSR